jgi:5'-methylthioadenosine phosphorylase
MFIGLLASGHLLDRPRERRAQGLPRHRPALISRRHAFEHALVSAPERRDPTLLARLDAVAGRVLNR